MPQTFAGFDRLLAQLRAKLPDDEPVIEHGNKEGYGFIHLFGGIQGAYVKAQRVRNWIYHVPGSRYDTPGTIRALGKLQQWGKAGYFNDDYNALGYDASATGSRRARASSGSAATGTRRSSRPASAPRTSA